MFGFSDFQIFRFLDFFILRFPNFQIFGCLHFQIFGFSDFVFSDFFGRAAAKKSVQRTELVIFTLKYCVKYSLKVLDNLPTILACQIILANSFRLSVS